MSIRLMSAVWEAAPAGSSTLLVLLALADHANDAGAAWPSVAGLAQRARITERQVRRALVELEVARWVEREMRPGRKTMYRVTPQETPDVGVLPDVGVTPDTHVRPDIGVRADMEGTDPGHPGPPTPDTHVRNPGHPRPTNRKEPPVEPSGNHHPVHEALDRFDEFWAVWPRREKKPEAIRAWTAALKRTDAQTVIDGAVRYRDDPNRPQGDERRFIPHPATWLRNDGWGDEPQPPRDPGTQTRSPGRQTTDDKARIGMGLAAELRAETAAKSAAVALIGA